MVTLLPLDIFRFIASYSTHDDFHYLLNTTKQSFPEIKKRLIVLNLNILKSSDYILDDLFRERVLSMVENGWKQVNLYLANGDLNISSNIPIHSLSFRDPSIPPLKRLVHIEEFRGIHWTGPFPPLQSLKKLHILGVGGSNSNLNHLSHLEYLEMSHARFLTDVNVFRNIPTLNLHECVDIQDFSMFHCSRQKSLVLDFCPHLVSVENFRMIHRLELSKCDNLEDVSPLYGIHDLALKFCAKVKDISGLGGHHRLILNNCSSNMTGYESLLHIPHVSLANSNIIDVTVFRYAKSISLYWCKNIKDVSALVDVKTVEIRVCDLIKDVSLLKSVQSLTLMISLSQDQLHQLKNWRVDLRGPSNFSPNSFSFLQPEVQHLTLHSNQHFIRLLSQEVDGLHHYFRNLQSLTLEALFNLKNVNGLGDIPHLRIIDCYNLKDIKDLGRNRCVEIEMCKSLEDVSSLATVPVVIIKQCPKIDNYDKLGLDHVPRLKLVF